MIHLFDIEKEADLSSMKESINDGLLNIGSVEIALEQTTSVGFQSYYLDQYSLRDKNNHNVDNSDSFLLNDTFDRKSFTTLSIQDGFFQENLPSTVLPNNKLLALGNSDLQTEIDTEGPELFQYKNIVSITPGTTTGIESTSHGLIAGDILFIQEVLGMIEINNQFAVVLSVDDADNITVNIDSSTFTGYTSGGTLRVPVHPISNIGLGVTTQVTTQRNHDLAVNDYVVFYGVSGCKQINGLRAEVISTPSSNIFVVALDSSEFSPYKIQLVSMVDSSFNSYSVYYGGYVSKMPSEKYIAWADRLSSRYVYDSEDAKTITHTEDYSSLTNESFWRLISKSEKKFAMKFYEFFSGLDRSGGTPHRLDYEEFDYNLTTPEAFDDLKNRVDEDPKLYSWLQNKTDSGYKLIHYNVQDVFYSDDNVFIKSTGIPEYLTTIDVWKPSATNQMWSFEIQRSSTINANKTSVPLGPVGVLKNGIPLYNFKNGQSFRGLGLWNDNTVVSLKPLYDANNGILTPEGAYVHNHSPIGLYDVSDTDTHSPLLGYALDGSPIYGPYGYTDYSPEDSSTDISRVVSGYTLRDITERSTLPDETVLDIPQYGPPIPAYNYDVKVATTENLVFTYLNNQGNNATLTSQRVGYTVIDTVTIDIGDNVLVKDQIDPAVNGIYEVILASPSSYTTLRRVPIHNTEIIRSLQKGQYNEADYGYNTKNGNKVLVSSGRQNANTSWILLGAQKIGVTPVTATQFEAYPSGYFVEDFKYTGDGETTLDQYNGRYCRTPEYPDGVYAYFMTINANGTPAYPYAIGEEYYGYVSDLAIRNAGRSKVYDKVKNYINKTLGLRIQILQNDKLYELTSLSPETWEENFSKSSSFGIRDKNFFYNKTIGLDWFASLELLEELGFDTTLDEPLEFAGNVETIPSNTYETETIDGLRSATRIDPDFDSETGTWSDTGTGYRTFVSSSSYDYDVADTNTYVSRRLDSVGRSNPITVEMYSTIVIDVPASSIFYSYFNQTNWGGSMILDWEIFTVSYGYGAEPYGEAPYGGE